MERAGRIGSSGFVALAHATIGRLEARGVDLRDARRLYRCDEILRQAHNSALRITRDDPKTLDLVARAVCDIREFYLIARTLPRERNADTEGKLRVVLRGSAKAKEYQFEFLLGALLAVAGIKVRPEPPDLRFQFGGAEWGIAAKRVTSGGQLAKRTQRAVEQLEEQRIRGIIAVNVDAFIRGLDVTEGKDGRWEEFDTRVARLHRLYPALAEQDSLVGIMAVGQVVEWLFDGPTPHLEYPWFFRSQGFNGNETVDRILVQLRGQLAARMADIEREIELIVGPRAA
jgi:hypothetical protein